MRKVLAARTKTGSVRSSSQLERELHDSSDMLGRRGQANGYAEQQLGSSGESPHIRRDDSDLRFVAAAPAITAHRKLCDGPAVSSVERKPTIAEDRIMRLLSRVIHMAVRKYNAETSGGENLVARPAELVR